MKKINVGVVFGGKTEEHEVSIISGFSIIKHLDLSKYNITPIYVDIKGQWHFIDQNISNSEELEQIINKIRLQKQQSFSFKNVDDIFLGIKSQKIDVLFPIIHGSSGEDGVIQGVFEMLNIPYVGANVLSSAVSMDKEASRLIVQSHDIDVIPFIKIQEENYVKQDKESFTQSILKKFGFPVFVKPSASGSSIGINKVKKQTDLDEAINYGFKFDQKVLVDKFLQGREIEVAVLENVDDYNSPIISDPGEIKPQKEFYDYEAKYVMKNGAIIDVPANITTELKEKIRSSAGEIFKALGCNGLARVDFFIENGTNKIFFSELNSLPGFTKISLYPKLMGHYGIGYSKLLDKLIEVAYKNFTIKNDKRDFVLRVLDGLKLKNN